MRPSHVILLVCGCGRVDFDQAPTPADVLPDSARAALMSTALAYWKFDDGSGTTAFDSTGNGNTLSLVNGPRWTTGIFDGAVSADGIDDYLVTLSPLALSTTSAITISLWSRRAYTIGPNHTLIELSPNYNSSATGFGFFPDDDDVGSCAPIGMYIGLQGNAGYTMHCYAQPASNVWHHLVVVYDKAKTGAAEVAFFLDGVSPTPTGIPVISENTNSFGDNPLYLFSRGGAFELNAGELDEVSVFARALTPDEIGLLD